MRSVYRVLAGLVAIGVVLQAMFIALGWFIALKDVDDGLVIDKNYDGNVGHVLHGQFGILVIPILALLLLIVSFFAHVPGGIKWALYRVRPGRPADRARVRVVRRTVAGAVARPERFRIARCRGHGGPASRRRTGAGHRGDHHRGDRIDALGN